MWCVMVWVCVVVLDMLVLCVDDDFVIFFGESILLWCG